MLSRLFFISKKRHMKRERMRRLAQTSIQSLAYIYTCILCTNIRSNNRTPTTYSAIRNAFQVYMYCTSKKLYVFRLIDKSKGDMEIDDGELGHLTGDLALDDDDGAFSIINNQSSTTEQCNQRAKPTGDHLQVNVEPCQALK